MSSEDLKGGFSSFLGRKPFVPCFCAKVQLRCREKMRPKMYFLRASHKSPQMFLAGYFIGASDRWSWWKKKMVLQPPPTTTYFRDVPCGRRSPQRRTTRQRHHPRLRSKLSYLPIYVSKPSHAYGLAGLAQQNDALSHKSIYSVFLHAINEWFPFAQLEIRASQIVDNFLTAFGFFWGFKSSFGWIQLVFDLF